MYHHFNLSSQDCFRTDTQKFKIKLLSFHNIEEPREKCFLYQIGSFSLLWSCNKSRSFLSEHVIVPDCLGDGGDNWASLYHSIFTNTGFRTPNVLSSQLLSLAIANKRTKFVPRVKTRCFFSCPNYFPGIILVISRTTNRFPPPLCAWLVSSRPLARPASAWLRSLNTIIFCDSSSN